ncbi:MAG: hypothetical protein CMO11_03530 [Thaumarchaeota archaeon]|nr:hypothetical protein [Nitrososphaerota archaeon]
MESSYNIQRRFRLLFRLPSAPASFFLATAIVLSILFIQGIFAETVRNLNLIPLFLILFFSSIVIERIILWKHPFATFRRLFAVSILPNTVWAVLSAFGLYRFTVLGSEDVFYVMALMGMFSAISIRILILGSVFFNRIVYGVLVSIIQPLILFASIPYIQIGIFFPKEQLIQLLNKEPFAFSIGIMIPLATMTYLILLNKTGGDILKNSPVRLLQAFLQAWVSERPKLFEELFDKISLEKDVSTKILEFKTKTNRSVLIVPEVHPGPFHPIGSSNLPFDLWKWFSNKKYQPLVFHGISGHEHNLPSKNALENYLSSMENFQDVSEGNLCTEAVSVNVGKATVTGFGIGDHALIMITLSPHGMEDFPIFVREKINKLALGVGFNGLILIDSHNSQGSNPMMEDCGNVIEASNRLLRKIRFLPQFPFEVGYAHSSQLDLLMGEDIGPAGIGMILLKINGKTYEILGVDANNMVLGLREKLMVKSSLIEICTSDTHYNASKVMNKLGYSPLGSISSEEDISSVINKLERRAKQSLEKGIFSIKYNTARVRVLGSSLLDDYSIGMDKVFNIAKTGGVFLFLITLIIYSLGYTIAK